LLPCATVALTQPSVVLSFCEQAFQLVIKHPEINFSFTNKR
jgi:hypothetical protein